MSLAFDHDGNHSRCDCLGAKYSLLVMVAYYCIILLRSWTLDVISGHLSHVLYYLLMLCDYCLCMAYCTLDD